MDSYDSRTVFLAVGRCKGRFPNLGPAAKVERNVLPLMVGNTWRMQRRQSEFDFHLLRRDGLNRTEPWS
jgi:hypothetical protein